MEMKTIRPRILLHSCCGPCSTAVIERLEQDYDLTVFYYNPNIMDENEYESRKTSQINFLKGYKTQWPIRFIEGEHEIQAFSEVVRGLEGEPEGGQRCAACFRLRLEKTAIFAMKEGYDGFCTTLSVSPHKNAQVINELGLEMEKTYNVRYLISDFKKKDGYRRSIEMAKEYGLYRQSFCGCPYSK